MDSDAILAARKAVEQIRAIADASSPARWPFVADPETLEHDLAVLLHHGVLERASVLGFDKADRQTYYYKITFRAGSPDEPHCFDSARSVELPLLPPGMIERLSLSINTPPSHLRPRLKGPWDQNPSPPPREEGETVDLEHAPRITGGRQATRMTVDGAAMHLLEVTFHRDRYGFAQDHTLSVGGVFL